MQTVILAGLALYLIQVYATALLYFPQVGLARHVRGRDDLPEPSILVGRAQRALANSKENQPVFLALGLLALVVDGADMDLLVQGGWLFLAARLFYMPAYMVAAPFLRSTVFTVGLIGLAMMAVALV